MSRASVNHVLARTLPRRMKKGPLNTRNWQRGRGNGYFKPHLHDPGRLILRLGRHWKAMR